MKKLLIIASLVYVAGCNVNNILDQSKPWILDYKDVYTNEVTKIGMSRYRVTDGDNCQWFDDLTTKYNIGDTLHGKIIPTTVVDTLTPQILHK